MARHEWIVPLRSGPSIRVKRWSEIAPGEVFLESPHLAAHGVMDALAHAESTASAIYADICGLGPHDAGRILHWLDERAWGIVRRAFERGQYVIVPLHPAQAGRVTDWTSVPTGDRLAYVMGLLVDTYHYSVNGAAGIVGNLYAESKVLPNRIEGSAVTTPLRSANFALKGTDFTPEDVMNRSEATKSGPIKPGIGLAQWTSRARRAGLFHRTAHGHPLGASVLYDMDAQVAYLVEELRARPDLNASLTTVDITVDDASDNVVYQFEIPGTLLLDPKHKRPRNDAAAQAEFARRRPLAHAALRAYQTAKAAP